MAFNNRLEQFVEYFKVQDRAIIGRLTNMVRIKDPSTGLLIASIRDPKIDINPYTDMSGVIDMQEAIINGTVPVFNSEVAPMSFDIRRLGWHTMLDLIKTKKSKKQFWEFIERLRNVRLCYNQILLNKFMKLSKTLKRNLEVQQLFNEMAIAVTPDEGEKSEDTMEKEPKKQERKGEESNAAKVSKQIEEFMAKVSGMMG